MAYTICAAIYQLSEGDVHKPKVSTMYTLVVEDTTSLVDLSTKLIFCFFSAYNNIHKYMCSDILSYHNE